MLKGYKTYLGIATAALGVGLSRLGLGGEEASAMSSQIVGVIDDALTIGGLLFAAYGRAKAKPAP